MGLQQEYERLIRAFDRRVVGKSTTHEKQREFVAEHMRAFRLERRTEIADAPNLLFRGGYHGTETFSADNGIAYVCARSLQTKRKATRSARNPFNERLLDIYEGDLETGVYIAHRSKGLPLWSLTDHDVAQAYVLNVGRLTRSAPLVGLEAALTFPYLLAFVGTEVANTYTRNVLKLYL